MAEAAEPRTRETEEELIQRAQDALNHCNWVIGECAAQWTKRYAKGRTDADFGGRIGLSGDQVYQRRRVWETFSDVRSDYSQLKWSHFYAALNWDDAAECLKWADEMQATVAEMKAWRRAQLGQDLSAQSDEDAPFAASAVEYLSPTTGMVRDPGDDPARGRSPGARREGGGESATVAAAARGTEEDPYSPFGKAARGSAPAGVADKPQKSTEAVLRSLTSALEKCGKALTPAVLEDFPVVSLEVRKRFLSAVKDLSSKTAGLK